MLVFTSRLLFILATFLADILVVPFCKLVDIPTVALLLPVYNILSLYVEAKKWQQVE